LVLNRQFQHIWKTAIFCFSRLEQKKVKLKNKNLACAWRKGSRLFARYSSYTSTLAVNYEKLNAK
jgi:hypothetical protein